MSVALRFDLAAALRWLLAVLFVWAALGKLADLNAFLGALAAYRLPLPDIVLRFVAVVLPWLELLCGVLLVVNHAARRAAVAWTVVLCAVFALATGQAWARGLDIACGCFNLDFLGRGALVQSIASAPFAFGRSILLLACAVGVWRRREAEDGR